MQTTFKITLDRNWVLAHREDEVKPADFLLSALRAEYKQLEVIEKSYAMLIFALDVSAEDTTAQFIRKTVCDKYSLADANEVLTVSQSNNQASPDAETKGDASSAIADLLSSLGKKDDKYEKKPAQAEAQADQSEAQKLSLEEQIAKNSAATLKKIDELVGVEEFKKLAYEIVKIAPQIIKNKTYDAFFNRCYLFSIADGNGYSTCLKLFIELLGAIGLCKVNSYQPVKEIIVKNGTDDKASDREFEPYVNSSRGKGDYAVVSYDISEWTAYSTNSRFRSILQKIEKSSDNLVVVFRVPFVEREVLKLMKQSIEDILFVQEIIVSPLSASELRLSATKLFENYNYKMSKGAWDIFDERINRERNDGRFYGLNTVKKVVYEALYCKQLTVAETGVDEREISLNDIKSLCEEAVDVCSADQMLSKLVGMERVRQSIDEIVCQIEFAKKNSRLEAPCIHMRFVGNPGTGKTTVARILGKLLREKGLLRIGAFFECTGRDLCGRYVGETAPKTASVCRDAYGSVLFIDEAYSLYREGGSKSDFGREALDTLIAEMENHRDDMLVIMAGYTDEMETLMSGNAGLKSRVPYCINFPNFTREQLYGIFEAMVKEQDFATGEGFLDEVKKYFAELPDSVILDKKFSNGRYVRNLFERTWGKAAMRSRLEGEKQVVLIKDDFARSISDGEFTFRPTKSTKIGF